MDVDVNHTKLIHALLWQPSTVVQSNCVTFLFSSGLYLWEHILEGPLNPTDKVAQWREGELQSGKIDFR